MAIAETWWATVSCSSRASCDALLALHLLEPPLPGAVLGADRQAEGDGAQQDGGPADRVADTGPADEDPERGGDQDDHQTGGRLAPGSPPEQRVRQHQEVDHRVHLERRGVGDDQRDVDEGGRGRRRPRRPRTGGCAARAASAPSPPSPARTATAAGGPREAWPPARRPSRRRPAEPSRARPGSAPRAVGARPARTAAGCSPPQRREPAARGDRPKV